MAALDARHVHEAGRAADERPTRESELGHGLQPPLRDGARAIADALAPFEEILDARVLLHALEFVEGREIGVGIVEMNDEADGAEILAPVIHKEAAAGVIAERPAHRVHDKTALVSVLRKLPELLQPDAVLLRVAAFL